MSEVQGLIETDRLATLSINGSDSLYWDGVACVFTSFITWIPLAIIAIYVLLRNVKSKRIVLVLFLVALTVLLCDQLSSSVAKPMFHRLRPTRDPYMLDLVDTVGGYRGGYFGFFSGHAANSFGMAALLAWFVKDKWFTVSVFLWAIINSLTRTYLGVHFAGDIIAGAIAGCIVGSMVYLIYHIVTRKDVLRRSFHDSNLIYTKSGFLRSDVLAFQCVLYATYSVILIVACIKQGI